MDRMKVLTFLSLGAAVLRRRQATEDFWGGRAESDPLRRYKMDRMTRTIGSIVMGPCGCTIPAHFTTAMEVSQFFLQRHHGDADTAAQEMEAALHENEELYAAMVDELVRIAIEEKACRYVAGRGQV